MTLAEVTPPLSSEETRGLPRWEEHEMNEAPWRLEPPPLGERPASLSEVAGPQWSDPTVRPSAGDVPLLVLQTLARRRWRRRHHILLPLATGAQEGRDGEGEGETGEGGRRR